MNTEKTEIEKPLLIGIGYMLKIIKIGLDYSNFKTEFDNIKHGNYDAFIENVGVGKSPIIALYAPEDLINKDLNHKNFGHWMGLFLSIPSVVDFHTRCVKHFGVIQDEDLSDNIFIELAYFEIIIRMHADTIKVAQDRASLKEIIDAFFKRINASEQEIKSLHRGRDFLNDVKHINELKYKRKFDNWLLGYEYFKTSLEILEKYNLKFSY